MSQWKTPVTSDASTVSNQLTDNSIEGGDDSQSMDVGTSTQASKQDSSKLQSQTIKESLSDSSIAKSSSTSGTDNSFQKPRQVHSARPFTNSGLRYSSIPASPDELEPVQNIETKRVSKTASFHGIGMVTVRGSSHSDESHVEQSSDSFNDTTDKLLHSSTTHPGKHAIPHAYYTLPFMSFYLMDRRLIVESLPSLLFSVIGLVMAGSLLDVVQHWSVFTEISELIILVPVLLNLKGNLEMNLAARISTSANLGYLDKKDQRNQILLGNLAVMQIQGIVVGAIAGMFSFILGIIVHGNMDTFAETCLMLAGSMITASISSLFLGALMCAIVLFSRFYKINPDNIATPLAASLGDIVTLSVLAASAFIFQQAHLALNILVILSLVCILPFLGSYVQKNSHVKHLLYEGWSSLVISMVICSFAGLILEQYITRYKGMALLSPVLNGIIGNLGAIYTSRYATALHGNLEEDHATTFRTLFATHFPIQLMFIIIMACFDLGHIRITFEFLIFYFMVSNSILAAVLYLSKFLCSYLWKRDMDPHQHVLPYLTAVADVLGTLLLMLAFFVLESLNLLVKE